MKKGKKTYHDPIVKRGFGGILTLLGLVVLFAGACYYGHNRVQEIHKEVFNAEAPISYDFDFAELAVIASTKITSQPKVNESRWKELPFVGQPQVYRVTHRIGFGFHHGTIELKVVDNKTSFLGTDLTIHFVAGVNDIGFDITSFKYDAQGFRLSLGDMSGTFSPNGHIRLKMKGVEVKMVNYVFRLSDVEITVPSTKKSIQVLASKIFLDDINLDSSKIVFMGSNPFEVKLDSSFKTAPVELHWNIQKTSVLDQDVRVSSGNLRFPASLLEAYVDPKVSRLLLAKENEAQNGGNDKVRFLFSVAKEMQKAEVKATVLRQLGSGRIQRDGEFYVLRVDKQDAFKLVEEHTQKLVERQEFLKSWTTLPRDKMLEEAFFALIFGDQNRAEAVRELTVAKEKELNEDPLFQALKLRLAIREAQLNDDDYSASLIGPVLKDADAIIQKLGSHKFSSLLRLEIARVKKDKILQTQLFPEYISKEEDPQLKAMFSFLQHLHSDNAKALEALEQAKNVNPKSLYLQNYLRHRIHIHRHAQDLVKMEADLKILFAETRLYPEDLANFATLLKEKKDHESALAAIEKCLLMDSTYKSCEEQKEEIMTQIALEKQKVNQDEAITYLENILVDRPASVQVNKGLAFLYQLKGDQDKSINFYSIACAMADSLACTDAGDSLSRKGDADRALLLYDVSCDFNSGNGCLKAGLQLEKAGQIEKSGAFYERSCNKLNEISACYHLARNMQQKRAANKEIAPYLTKACKVYPSACKLASIYQNTNKQPPIPLEPK